ncbi:MAG: hypothetical protein ABIQ60_08575 [Burkholderiaceae bacterium]
MNILPSSRQSTLALAATLAVLFASPDAMAQKSPKKGAAKRAKAVVVEKEIEPEPASAEQTEASGRVYYGPYACEFNQSITVEPSPKHPSYVALAHGKAAYLMKPVLSSTGAIRLEDVRGETLMVQIANKSMLLNVKTSQRIVDDCINSQQRDSIEAAKLSPDANAAGSLMIEEPAKAK